MQPGYLPWLGFFELMHSCEVFVLLDDVQYTKKDWRSRNRIRTKEGWIWLSVPVLTKGRRNQLIMEARINNNLAWREKHLRSLKVNYCGAGYYSNYISFFEQLYEKELDCLVDLDMEIIIFMAKKIGISTKMIRSSSLGISDCSGNMRIMELCKRLKADELYDSARAKDFLDLKLFAESGIKVNFQNYLHPVYKQLYQPFVSYLSAVDLLFNEGPGAREIILSGRREN